jgi:hypothetical protein
VPEAFSPIASEPPENEDGHVSNSRRGLLAAGLAAAVVGSTGVVWTLNASAAETSPAETTASAVAPVVEAVEEPVAVPPKLLPWGARPQRLTRAKAGASSAAVAAAGADAAPADTSGSMIPEPEFAPKGYTARGKGLKKMRTTLVPPTPPAVTAQAAAAAPARDVYFHYVDGTQIGETDGTWANLTIEKPELVQGDYHSLAELAVRSADSQHTVEVGWTVDRSVNGDSDPHLFVYHWVDGTRTCYNSCGFTMYSKTVKPGDTLPVGAQKRFGIQHSGNAWWIAYDSEWIGYFSDKNWSGKYTKAGVTQWFGEVASATEVPCSEMGNGLSADKGNAARIGSITMTNGPAVQFEPTARSKYYSVNAKSSETFRYGGPGGLKATEENPEYPC